VEKFEKNDFLFLTKFRFFPMEIRQNDFKIIENILVIDFKLSSKRERELFSVIRNLYKLFTIFGFLSQK
jgi:hypothetical protein